MNDDPLLPSLAEIIAQPEAAGVILSGGFGIRLKRYHLQKRNEAEGRSITLVAEIPEARATQDLDLLLNMGLWLNAEKAHAFSVMLKERLKYETVIHSWKYRKLLPGLTKQYVKLDLGARRPLINEPVKVKGNPKQVGREMKTGISGFETPEAFAVWEFPVLLDVPYGETPGSVLTPHSFAWLNLKVRAAHDWLREQRGEVEEKPTREGDRVRLKHVYDVYVLTAMLTKEELAQSVGLAQKYAEHEEASKTREQAVELYGSLSAPGVQGVQNYIRRVAGHTAPSFEYELFWEGLQQALGI